MPRRSSQHISLTKDPSSVEGDTSNGNNSVDILQVGDWPERVRALPSPSRSLSTTTSELEVEQGEALMRVKQLKAEEELEDVLPDTDDEADRPVPKKRKTGSAGMKRKGRKSQGA
jgi:hypothetical protein